MIAENRVSLHHLSNCINRNHFIDIISFVSAVQTNDPQFYEAMISTLNPENGKEIQEIINEANRKQRANGT